MNWKSWPYWKKGTLLIGGLYTLFVLVAGTFLYWSLSSSGDPVGKEFGTGVLMMLTFFPSSLLAFSQVALFFFGSFFIIAIPIINIVIFAGFGSFLGYLYGKFKNRKTKALPLS